MLIDGNEVENEKVLFHAKELSTQVFTDRMHRKTSRDQPVKGNRSEILKRSELTHIGSRIGRNCWRMPMLRDQAFKY